MFGRPSPAVLRERREAEKQANLRGLASSMRTEARGVYAGSTTGSAPKPEARYVDQALTDMAKDRPCLLLVPAICNHRIDTTVAAHSNLSVHGKAGARKADDCYSVWACSACHYWLDFGKAAGPAKEAAFMLAHANQVLAWRLIAMDQNEPERYRRAAARALQRLNVTPAGAAP
jgi:hypothetical protein